MHTVMTDELVRVRHQDLLREAAHQRQVLAARRVGAIGRASWRQRVGTMIVRVGQVVAGPTPSATLRPARRIAS